ncbi:hypothetical protein B0H11DRAFT_69890 [Mycena galericulata]|nr:hypothetical protein B0H11DRAFT_69890 [Mycena galericulata]
MSVHELEAQIEKISADIAGQKKILADLEKSKSLVQRQLNAVRDPVARLPLEISSEIFLRCLPPRSDPGAHRVPMLFLNICNAWTDIALSTPGLWATIRIAMPRAEGFVELLAAWLQRARSHPLSVSLSNNFDDPEGVAPLIWQYGQQLKHLEFCYGKEDDEDETIDVLGCSSPGPLPLLETLTFRCPIYLNDYLSYHAPQILELLRRAPNLVECMFDSVQNIDMYGVGDIEETLVLPNLRRLMFGNGIDNDPTGEDHILRCFTTPRLESLSVSTLRVSGYDLLSFLKRSSPPLRDLVLGTALGFDHFEGLYGCLHLVPTLARLEFWWWPVTRRLDELFPASLPDLLPNLRSLTIRLYLPVTEPLWWETLLRVLTARRTQFQNVSIEFGDLVPPFEIAANFVAGFKELVAGGMKLHIGNNAQNLLSL